MKTMTSLRRRFQPGYSLAEVMVAMAILTIVILAALTIYDRSNRMFNQGVQASDMQQSTRVAFDRLVSDIRLTGFDYDRDGIPFGAMAPSWTANTSYVLGNTVQPNPQNGHVYQCLAGGTSAAAPPAWPTTNKATVTESTGVQWQEKQLVYYQQPDEQIEYAGPNAITIRANFDYNTEVGPCPTTSTPDCENGREQQLQSDQFPLVTTDNDEIVTYVLKSNKPGASNSDSVVFYADTDRPRDVNPATKKKENKVTISGVDLSNANPPYTLYRYTLSLDNSATPVATPIADNIRSLTFHYYTDVAATAEMLALPYGNGQYDGANPDATVAERDTRATIKAIRIDLVGMNPNIDAAFNDTTDTAAPHYRKYELDSLIVPRNIGKHGMREFTTLPPSAPTIKTVCAAACNSVYVTWDGPSTGGDVDSYNIVYDAGDCAGNLTGTTMSCTGCNPGYAIAEDAGSNLEGYATKITPGKLYRFSIQAVNKYGSATGTSCIAVNVLNMDKPAAPTGFDASGGSSSTYPAVANGIQLYWDPVTTHDSSNNTMSCSDGSTKTITNVVPGESIRYRIRRSKDADMSGATTVLDENTAVQPGVVGTKAMWVDTTAPMGNCINYYYQVRAVTVPCCSNGAMNQGGNSQLARSTWTGDASSGNGLLGRASTAQIPDKPTNLAAASQNCSGGNCDVAVTWSKTTNATAATGGGTMLIDSYQVNLYKQDLVTGLWNPVPAGAWSPVANGATSTVIPSLDTLSFYKITVTALDCNTGVESDPVLWPCNWGGGNINIQVPNYGGAGTQGSPYDIQYPTSATVTTTSAIQKVDWVLSEGATVLDQNTVNGPGTTFNIPFEQNKKTDDGVTARLHLVLTGIGAGACAYTRDIYLVDQPPPPCALVDQNTDATVLAVNTTGNYVDITLKNKSADILTPKSVSILWNTSNQGPAKFSSGISSVTFDNNGAPKVATNASCSGSKYLAVAPSGTTVIAANQQNYVVRVQFAVQAGKNLTGNPITNVCVQYQTPFGDVNTCSVAPNAGTCVASTCP